MEFTLPNPNATKFADALGISEDRSLDMQKQFSEFLKQYKDIRVNEKGSMEQHIGAAAIAQGFLLAVENGNIEEVVFAAFHAGAKTIELRTRHQHSDIPHDMPDFLKAILRAIREGSSPDVEIRVKKKKKKDEEEDPE